MFLKNVLFGDRFMKYCGEMVFTDAKNGLECVVKVDPSAEKSVFSKMLKGIGGEDEVFGDIVKDDRTVLDRCEGTWLSHLDWGVKSGSRTRYWTIGRKQCVWPSMASGRTLLLQSDCNRRPDIKSLRLAEKHVDDAKDHARHTKNAQDNKVMLEERQRADAKLRLAGVKR